MLELSRALIHSGRGPEARALLERERTGIFEADRELGLACESELLAAILATPGARPDRDGEFAWLLTR